MTTPTLPQDSSSEQLAARQREIAWAQTLYTWAHSYTYKLADGQQLKLAPIAVLAVDEQQPLPESQKLNLVQILEIIDQGIALLSNVIINVTNLFNVGAVELDGPPPESFLGPNEGETGDRTEHEGLAARLRERVEQAVEQVTERVEQAVEKVSDVVDDIKTVINVAEDADEAATAAETLLDELRSHRRGLDVLSGLVHEALDDDQVGARGRTDELTRGIGEIFEKVIEVLLDAAAAEVGLFGRPKAMSDYDRQFQAIVVPNVTAVTMTDDCFARMRVAGPNPLLIRKIDALPQNFPVDPERFESATGEALDAALKSGRVYLVDYQALGVIEPGDFPAGQKYISPALALFALGEDLKALRPVAIQCSQTPGNSNPVFYPDDGESWELAKYHVQSADGNYHELISHLGLTHLLIEPFAVATHRNLSQQHPLFRLLLPHFQGTLFINQAAITSLINPGGTVDKLLAGTIQSDWAATTTALGDLSFNDHMLPNDLATRGVADKAKFPDYPYRDDAMPVWEAIKGWVRDYLSIYYNDDAAVTGDMELQAWYQDLVLPEGGGIKGLGELGPTGELGLRTLGYLVDVVTMVIFTSSAQHAAVNFPQHVIMSYTPAMPLAMYAPAPTQVSGPLSPDTALADLPPLQMALVQLLVGQLLGGVYFTRLGDYDRHQRAPWFGDPRVDAPLQAFQNKLREVEREIGARNLERPCYEFLLPSRIPQSINI
ncbi:MAG: lipoxygenase family protein [Myxococcota bacterium]